HFPKQGLGVKSGARCRPPPQSHSRPDHLPPSAGDEALGLYLAAQRLGREIIPVCIETWVEPLSLRACRHFSPPAFPYARRSTSKTARAAFGSPPFGP